MRMLIHAKIPHDPFNGMVRNGTAGKVIGQILEEIEPEAAYQDLGRAGLDAIGKKWA